MMAAMKYGRVSAASMAWPLNGAPSAHPKAEQRESKLEGGNGVCAKALQQRTGRVSKHHSVPRFGFRAFFWIGSMDC